MPRSIDRLALRDFLSIQARLPQRLGVIDCTTFVVEGLLIGWGIDIRDGLRYWDRRSAVRQLREEGGLQGAFCKRFGAPIPVGELQEGDIVYMPNPATVGLILSCTDGLYAAVKMHYQVARFELLPELTGWRPHG